MSKGTGSRSRRYGTSRGVGREPTFGLPILKTSRAHHPVNHLESEPERRVRRRLVNRRGSRRHQGTSPSLSARPPVHIETRLRPLDDLPFLPSAFIFDVEGTLVDNALPTLQCWSETLAELGFSFGIADLHPFLGMDGRQMLRGLIKKNDVKLLDHIVALQAERYSHRYLSHVRPFPGVRRLFAGIKANNGRIALATSADREETAHYRGLLNVDDLLDVVCCGDDVKREKPRPDIVSLAAKKLHRPADRMVMVGDTPSDAEAARGAGLTAIGVQSGHFSRSDLVDAGCASVFFDLHALGHRLPEPPAPAAESIEPARSHTAEAADSR